MLELHFDGWFQCRLATDPDPADEQRGVSGWTFAVGDEPDLDRIIRFHNPVAARSNGPNVGVFVRKVCIAGIDVANHPLRGATFNLLDSPVFEGRNGIFYEDEFEPIDPFHLRIEGGGIVIERRDELAPGATRIGDVTPEQARKRVATASEAFSPEVADYTCIFNYSAHRARRLTALNDELLRTTEPAAIAGLQTRIRELSLSGRELGLREIGLGLRLNYRFELKGPTHIEDFSATLGGEICVTEQIGWPIDFWVGAWDADALCGFARGRLSIPFASAQYSS